jgi:signal transduction histidine kinase/CheY-like chemotaxis protein/HPt (histidine-containing phosphotransfer) domain-containing protein
MNGPRDPAAAASNAPDNPEAAEDPTGSPSPAGAATWPTWLLAAVALAVALLALVLVTGRQLSDLHAAARVRDEPAATAVHDAEVAYWRLREAWSVVADGQPGRAEIEALRQRWAAWSERLRQLEQEPARDLLADTPGSRAILLGLRGLHTQAEPLVASPALAADSAIGGARSLWPAFAALAAPMADLGSAASRRVAERAAERSAAAERQHQLGWNLLLGLVALISLFALVLGTQLRRLRERRVALERLTRHLREARREAESASQAKSRFLAHMSHEIRTPFHGLMGMLSLLRESGLGPRQIDHLRSATESADHLLAILNDLLDVAQLERGQLELHPGPCELRPMLREVEAPMRPQAMARRLALHIDADPAVPEWIVADGKRLKQILFELVGNAIEFSERGAVVLDVRLRPDAHGQAQLEFIVTDTGIGMDESTIAGLFQRFQAAEQGAPRGRGGTGLGLDIARSLARLMGGDIVARSRIGEGSVFTLRLPVATTGTGPPPPGQPASATRRLKVLVAEDHPVNRQYLAAVLERLGHEATFGADGREALAAAERQRFDVVLMDLHMPGMDGIAATRAIRGLADPTRSTVPILALTADAFAETRERCLLAGMNDFLAKPVSPEQLAAALRQLFGSEQPPEAAVAAEAPAAGPRGPGSRPGDTGPALLDEATLSRTLQALPRDRVMRLLAEFMAQAPDTLRHLRSAVRDAQPLELRVNAHAVKGAALNLGLSALAETAAALQEGASHLPAHEIALLVRRFEEQLQATEAALRARGLLPIAAPTPLD